MDAKLIELIRRRERLLVRAESQRAELAGIVQQWHTPIVVADRALAVVRALKEHPVLLALPLAALAAWRPRQLTAWAGRAWFVWRVWRDSPLLDWLKNAK
ncbi:MAG: YqjK-like family protein [Sulfuricellaceae bacterium]